MIPEAVAAAGMRSLATSSIGACGMLGRVLVCWRLWHVAPVNHPHTLLPLLQVVMDYLDPSEGWTNLASLPTPSQQQAQSAVTAAVQRMHAVVITDPATGKEGPVAHGDLRLTNIMLCKGQASETWTDAKVLFVDFDCKLPCGTQRLGLEVMLCDLAGPFQSSDRMGQNGVERGR